jgi:hypothetical protein
MRRGPGITVDATFTCRLCLGSRRRDSRLRGELAEQGAKALAEFDDIGVYDVVVAPEVERRARDVAGQEHDGLAQGVRETDFVMHIRIRLVKKDPNGPKT